jgi:hypothetical protein
MKINEVLSNAGNVARDFADVAEMLRNRAERIGSSSISKLYRRDAQRYEQISNLVQAGRDEEARERWFDLNTAARDYIMAAPGSKRYAMADYLDVELLEKAPVQRGNFRKLTDAELAKVKARLHRENPKAKIKKVAIRRDTGNVYIVTTTGDKLRYFPREDRVEFAHPYDK